MIIVKAEVDVLPDGKGLYRARILYIDEKGKEDFVGEGWDNESCIQALRNAFTVAQLLVEMKLKDIEK